MNRPYTEASLCRLSSDRSGELLFVGQIDAQRRHRNITLLDGPAIGTLFGLFDGNNAKPEMFAAHGIFAGHNFPVVVPDRLACPLDTFRLLLGKVDVDERQARIVEQYLHNLLNGWLQYLK